jgi:hypothetical protein
VVVLRGSDPALDSNTAKHKIQRYFLFFRRDDYDFDAATDES